MTGPALLECCVCHARWELIEEGARGNPPRARVLVGGPDPTSLLVHARRCPLATFILLRGAGRD